MKPTITQLDILFEMADGAIILTYYRRGHWRYLFVTRDRSWCMPVTRRTMSAIVRCGWIGGAGVYTITPAGRKALKGGAKCR